MHSIHASRTMLREYPDVLDIKQLSMALNISKKTAYKLIQDGAIYNLKIGREYRIPKVSVIQYLLGINPSL